MAYNDGHKTVRINKEAIGDLDEVKRLLAEIYPPFDPSSAGAVRISLSYTKAALKRGKEVLPE